MKTTISILLIACVCALGCIGAMAQSSGTNSPYSRYGWGQLSSDAAGFNRGMAGLALGVRNINIINRQNPAAYSELDSLTFLFDAGISLQNDRLKNGGDTKNAQNAAVDYLEAAFRFTKGLGFSLGLRPFSIVGYDFSATETMEDVDGYGSKTTTSAYVGDGGLHSVYAGIGWNPIGHISVGANANYIWGDYNHSSSVTYSDQTIRSLTRYYKGRLNAVTFDFGLQYEQMIGKNDMLTIGAVYGLGNKVDQRATFINLQSNTSTSTTSADTVNVGNAYQLPSSFGVGFTWNHQNKLTIGFDYVRQMWKDCRFPELVSYGADATYAVAKNTFMDRQKFIVGVEYMPNPRGLRVRDHIKYRAGFAYQTPYTKVNGKDGAKSYLVTLGAALPIVNKYSARSVLNLSAEWEHCSSKALSAVKEDYLRVCVGITFNAEWFNKWKVE